MTELALGQSIVSDTPGQQALPAWLSRGPRGRAGRAVGRDVSIGKGLVLRSALRKFFLRKRWPCSLPHGPEKALRAGPGAGAQEL